MQTQLMWGQLPESRLTPGPIFQHTGVDLLAQYSQNMLMFVNQRSRRLVCVFVSFGESCSSRGCDKTDFLTCLRQFVSRRVKVYSDHGTNFVGARISLVLLTRDLPNKPLLTIALVESSGIFSREMFSFCQHLGSYRKTISRKLQARIASPMKNCLLSCVRLKPTINLYF